MSVLGLDLGTSGVRAAAFALDGRELGSASASLELRRPSRDRVELDAAALIEAAESVVHDVAVSAAKAGDPVAALSFSVLGEAVVPIDASGSPLAAVAVSMDTRGHNAAAALGRRIGAERFATITGQPLHGMFSVFKIAAGDAGWQDAAGYRCMGDLLAERWTGVAGIDLSQAARTGLLDVATGRWSSELIEAFADTAPWIEQSRLPVPVAGGNVIGTVSSAAAARLGLPDGVLVVAGAHDQAAAFLGAGGAAGIRSVIAFGSSDCLTVATASRPAGLESTGFASYRIDEDRWITLAGTAAGGWALQWFAGIVGSTVGAVFGALSPDPPALLLLPYLAGSGTLDNDPQARGVLHGLTLETTVPEIARAVTESAGFEFREIVEAFAAHGVETGELAVTGSGSENAEALQARANAAGLPLVPVTPDASVRGAAQFAAAALGAAPAALLAPVAAPAVVPTAAHAAWYARQRHAYMNLYVATRDIASHLAAPAHQKENMP
ncbi:FGGY-family carbohydrate kinase [Microbacterium sp.]|uniref:FGGY-family carbohydrate kinase n=1 Tax=Microbacterium sp. TaxID=51671 RepID=UPI002BCED5B9|nr:FGGY family carbohydrate kinase [Microbacterium sp.]HWK76838.1 FGGY family carbohydrate kinase [Microbacterium sp.]